MNSTISEPGKRQNPQKTAAFIWWVLCVLLIAGIFTPFVLDFLEVDAGDWVFALMFFCLVFGITAIFIAVMYTKRARLVDRMLDNAGLLARWTYSPAEWSEYAVKEHEENKREKKNMFLLVAGIAAAIGIIMSFIYPDGGLIFIFTVLGIILVAGVAALLSVWLPYRQNRERVGEVYISPEGVYLNRVLHHWQGFGARLEDVNYEGEYRARPIIKIDYSQPNRHSRNYVTLRVPVPEGKEEAGKKVAEELHNHVGDGPAGRGKKSR